MRRYRNLFSSIENQQGMALISALLLLMVVSLMAVGMSTDTSMDVRIAGYQKFKAESFKSAESSVNAGTEILEDNIFDAGWAGPPPLTYPNLSGLYSPANGITIVNDENFYMNPNFARNPFITMAGDIQAQVVVQRLVSKFTPGGANQMAAGYEGLGKGAGGGGVQVIYNIESQGTSTGGAVTELGIHFRHVSD